ncbi:DUF1653 domain-containing protein [Anaerotruncus colihominis]|uniref:DUF1653 domain-containing protein n=1 Tax=Anaerotruncus colihominis TaxID=169435 RepID=UPI003AB867E7
MNWVNESVFYHIYPLGFCGAPQQNSGGEPQNRIAKIIEWLPHLLKLHINAVYLGPVFESSEHGYDTADYYTLDRRLGTNADFKKVCETLHAHGIRIVLDGVFNHVGRSFWAFEDVRKNGRASKYCGWFHNLNFGGGSPMGDPFWYEGWQGHFNLVKLNLQNPEVVDHLLGAAGMWMDEFGIDGLRLDAADCVDPAFFRRLRTFCLEKRPDFWLMGEIIHGDYNRWANPDMLDSVTNYECEKGLYSSHNDKNYFEIAYSLNRQFGNGGIYKNLCLYNFVDNHDINRLATMLRNRAHLYNTYTLLYTMPGVPSVYYGSEWGVTGAKQGGSDAPLRPCLELGQISGADEALCTHIARLGIIRRSLPALQYGTYEQKLVKNEQFVFERADDGRYVYIALNLSDHPEYVEFRVRTAPLTDLFTGTTFETNDGNLKLELPAFGARILVPPEDCARLAGAAHAAPGTPEPAQPVQAPDAPAARPDQPRAFRPGRYRHFKGNEYEAIGLARHSETLEQLVVYRALYGEGGLWVRPLDMFMEEIERDGKRIARFTYIGE